MLDRKALRFTGSFELCFGLASTASPPKAITLDEVMASARDLSNLKLAHEIIVNRNFRVEPHELPENRYAFNHSICDLLKAIVDWYLVDALI